MTDLAKLVVKLEAQTAEYQKNLEKASRQLDKFNKSAGSTAANIGKGLATAAVAAAGAFAFMAKSAIDNADRLNMLAQSTGVSVESLSQLEFAAKMSGVESETLTKALSKLSKFALSAAKDGGAAADSLKLLGISAQNADGSLRPTQDILLDLAEKFSTMEDGAAKTGLAMEVFGKSGAALIPFLNEGKAGIAALTKEADQLGLTVSGKAAAAADQFNDNLDRMQGAVKGVVNQAVQQMLPMLVAMSERFVASAKSGGALSISVQFLVGLFKGLVSAGVIVTSVFQQLGQIIYGVAAALLRVRKGQFSLAAEELSSAFANARANVTNDMETIAAVWSDSVPAVAAASKAVEEEVKENIIFNPEKAGKLAADAAAKAVESLRGMAEGMRQQVETFGMAEAAVLKYRIANGDLAEQIKTGGPQAAAYAAEILALQEKLDGLTASSDAAKQKQEDWAAVVAKGAEVTESVKTPLEDYQDRIQELNDLLDKGVISQETYNRAILTAQDAFEQANKTGTDFMEQASRNVQDILAQFLEDPFSSSLEDLVADFGQMLAKMAAQAIAADIAGKIFGTGGVGSGGGWLGQLGNLAMGALGAFGGGAMSGLGDIAITAQRMPVPFSGPRASGGNVMAGHAYTVGEQGKAELFVPQSNGRILPNAGGSSSTVINNSFSIAAPSGSISRSTEQQIAAAASRGLARASRRNN